MTKNAKIILVILGIVAVGAFLYSRSGQAPIVNPPIVEEDSILGCYVARLGKDVYTLTILSQGRGSFSGLLSFKNFEKDSSSGTYEGTYREGILLGDYSFRSEGMDSVMQVIFKRSGEDFVRGYGDLDETGTRFTDLGNITYDNSAVFKAEACGVSIVNQVVKEENWSGTRPIISGSGALVAEANKYVEGRIAEFRASANKEVPEMRAEFGVDTPAANYTLDINAKHIEGEETESIVMDEYVYTGGANGSSSYKAITASSTGEILSLSDIVKDGEGANFTAFVKKELIAWRPSGSTGVVVFEEAVNDLSFESFHDWTLDSGNLILYFDEYDIGPGVLGAVAFPIPLLKIKSFLNPIYFIE